jgi:hypothetical protein
MIGKALSVDPAQERQAQNETLFREVNERVEELAVGLTSVPQTDDFSSAFVCECGSETCVEPVRTTRSEYEAVRSNPGRFLVLPGHEDPAVERVVERHERYWVVQKVGEAGDLAIEDDPRS